MNPKSPGQEHFYAEKSCALASILFPFEEWIHKETNIWVARSRLSEEYREPDKWEREMSQVRILTGRGSAAYFLPERRIQGESGKRCADLILNGEIMEMKTTSGTRVTLGGEFRLAYKQGRVLLEGHQDIKSHSVFIRLLSELSIGSVKAKIAGELKNRSGQGSFICFFEHLGELHEWTYEELRTIIGKR